MKHAYPAIFYPDEDKIGVEVPDLPGLYTFGDDIPAHPLLFIWQKMPWRCGYGSVSRK